MTQNKSMTKYKENWAIRNKKVHESNAIPWPLAHSQNMKRNLVKYNKRRDVGSEGAEGAYAPSDPQTFRHPCEGLWKQLCYFWNNVTTLWVPSLLELGLVLGKITLVLVGVNTHGQSSHQVLDRRSPNYPQLSDHYLNCTTEKDLTRRPEWTLFEQAVFSPLISTILPYWNSARLNFTCDIHWIEDSIQVWFVRHPRLSDHYLTILEKCT